MEFICILILTLAVIFMWVALDRHKTKIVMLTGCSAKCRITSVSLTND